LNDDCAGRLIDGFAPLIVRNARLVDHSSATIYCK
jgi:hypothetical protein